MQDELIPLEEETGEFEDYGVAPASSDNSISAVLVILTSIFMVISIALIAFRLHTAYDFFKSKDDIQKKEKSISNISPR